MIKHVSYALSYTTRYSELRSFFFNKSVNSFPLYSTPLRFIIDIKQAETILYIG